MELFAYLSQENQKYANIFLHDIQSGNIPIERENTLSDTVVEYNHNAKNLEIKNISSVLGLDETKLRNMRNAGITKKNINEFGHFDYLKETVDKIKAKAYFEKMESG